MMLATAVFIRRFLIHVLSHGAPRIRHYGLLVPCACPPRTEGTRQCNYGRSCGHLLTYGRDVGQTMSSPWWRGPTSAARPPTRRADRGAEMTQLFGNRMCRA